ncbi:hypothetical protein GCM10023235_50530 [Kitasatospora terrestris]|uniref:Uncharacterized protein n=2 Tax=Kitasatospora terrestris TaxID=258051 RepID=A0ABP9E262_9ACTN
MDEPRILVHLQLIDGLVFGEHREACPECDCEAPLTVLLDSLDWSLRPAQVQCPWGHVWGAATMESWVGAHIVAMAKALCDDR